MARHAATIALSRSKPTGIKGRADRLCTRRVAISSVAPIAVTIATSPGVPTPTLPMPYTSVTSPAVISTAGNQGTRAGRVADAGVRRRASTNTTALSGRYKPKPQRHPRTDVSTPPATTPSENPTAPVALNTPSALLRGAPAGNVATINAIAAGAVSADPLPCTARATINWIAFCASAQPTEPTPNTVTPMTNSRFAPHRSAQVPP